MIYLFDKDERLIRIVSRKAVKTALQTFALTTERYVSDRLTVEVKSFSDQELEKVEYMAIQSLEDSHQFHYFYVAQKQSADKLTTLIGVQSGIEELRKTPVYDKRPKNAFAREVVTDLLAGTNWSARFVAETLPKSTNFYYTSVFDALKKVCQVWDLEMQFFVQMNGNQIGARVIDFKKKIGAAVGKRVVYGHNALKILQEVERTNIYTALIGRGKGEQISTADTSENVSGSNTSGQAANGYGRKITFADVVWRRSAGNPVDKPKGQEYVEIPAMTGQYGIRQANGSMRPKIGFIDFGEEEDKSSLLQRTYEALVDASRPQAAFKTSTVYLKGVTIGDTIRVVRHDKRIDYDTRIFELTVNRLDNQSSDIKLGDRITESQSSRAQTIADKAVEEFVANEFSTFVQNLPDYLPSADGFNNNWYGTEDPTIAYKGKVVVNDIWYKPDPEHEGHKIMLRWTGEAWEELVRTYETEAIKKEVEALQKQGEELQEDIRTGIEQAKAKAEVVRAEIGAEVEAVAREGQAVKQAVNAGLVEADRKAKAFESDIRNRVGQVETKANQVADQARQSDQKADQALTKAGTSETLAQTAKDTADRAIRQAGDNLRTAQERANQLQADLDTAKRSITSQARDILNQAQAQSDLTRKVKTVEETANGTKSTLTELTKTVNANTGNLTSVTQRVATAENTLTNVRNQYSTLKTAVDDQTGKVTILERQTADLSSGLDGVKERFDSIQIGAVNLFRLHPATKGYFKGTRNNDVVGSRYAYGPKISVESGGRYLLQVWAKQANDFSWIGYNQLDADGNHIAGSYSGTYPVKTGTYFKKVITTLPNAKYIQFSFSDDIFGDDPNLKIQFEKGTIPTDYQPAEEDFRHEFAEYKRTVTENTSRLEQSIQTADGKAESAKTLAQQTARVLELKAEKSTLDSVTGRVSSAEGTIRLQAEQIAQRLTSTQVDSLVSGKGYQTKAQVDANITGRGYITNAALAGYVPTTTFDNYKTETAQAIERGLTATRALIPTKIDYRNWILESDDKITQTTAEGAPGSKAKWFGFAEGFWKELNLKRELVLSVHVKGRMTPNTATNASRNNRIGIELPGITGWGYIGVWDRRVGTNIDERIEVKAKLPTGLDVSGLTHGISIYIQCTGDVEVSRPKATIGNVSSDWSPAPEDLVTSVDFNRVKETAELYERVIGRSEGDIQTNVARQVLTSQLYQTEVTKANWDSRNHIRNGSFVANGTHWNDNTANSGVSVNYDHSKAVDNRRRSGVHIWGTPSSRFKGLYQLFSLKATTGQKVTLSALVSRDGNGPGNMEWGLHFRRGGAIVNQTWKYITPGEVKQGSYERQVWTVSLPVDVDEINVMFYLESGKASNYYLTEISFAVSDRFVGYTDSLEDNAAVSTRVSQLADSYGIKVLGNKEKILSELNLNSNGVRIAGKLIHLDGTVTASDAFFRSVLADKIEAGNIKAGAVTTAKIAAGAVTADHLLVNQAMIDKLVTNSVWADRLFAQSAFMAKLQATKILAGQIDAGLINTAMLAANAVTADKLQVNQAMIDKLVTNSVWADRLFAQSAVINKIKTVELNAGKVTTGTLDAANVNIINLNANKLVGLDAEFIKAKIETALVGWLRGKVISAQNDAMRINLNQANITFNQNATIDFNSANNALVRRKGTHTAFVHFNDVNSSSDGGVGSLYASIGVTSSGDGVNSSSSGRFSGLRAFRGASGTNHNATVDQLELYGDDILFRDDFSLSRGLNITPTKFDKKYNMHELIGCLKFFARVYVHLSNVGGNWQSTDFNKAFLNEYNSYNIAGVLGIPSPNGGWGFY